MSLAGAVQAALYQVLTAALATPAPAVPVYDHVPENRSYPFVEIGELRLEDADLLDERMSTASLEVYVWSNARGQKQLHDLNARIRAALHDVQPPTAEGAIVMMRVASQVNDRAQDGVTYVSTTLLRLTLEH